MTTRTQYHADTGRRFLAQARAELEAGDLLQSSDKGWGAAAQAVKAAAEARGWSHDGHRQLYTAVDRLVQETGDRSIRTTFAAANTLHVNFYDGLLSREAVEDYLTEVEKLVGTLSRLTA